MKSFQRGEKNVFWIFKVANIQFHWNHLEQSFRVSRFFLPHTSHRLRCHHFWFDFIKRCADFWLHIYHIPVARREAWSSQEGLSLKLPHHSKAINSWISHTHTHTILTHVSVFLWHFYLPKFFHCCRHSPKHLLPQSTIHTTFVV